MSLFLSNFEEIATELSLTNLTRDNSVTIFVEFEVIATELSLANLDRDNSVTIFVEFEGNSDGIVPS